MKKSWDCNKLKILNVLRQNSRSRALLSFLLSCFITLGVFTGSVNAAPPSGGVVQAGSATINYNGANVEINQSTDKAIIHWNGFDIPVNGVAQFNQPGAGSITLNRIGGGATTILGKLTANGQIWLLNPNGILFGAGSQINVAGLLATTANITNEDFLSGNYKFSQASTANSAIVNEGTIIANGGAENGYVILAGAGVSNNGLIQANMGKVALAAGNVFTVDFRGDKLISFGAGADVTQKAVDAKGRTLNDAVSNAGTIIANGGRVLLTARAAEGVVNNAINMSGNIEAKAAVQNGRGGDIVLMGGDQGIVQVSGKMYASAAKGSGMKGGKVRVTGAKVALVDSALIDVSGDIGGGEVLIGGDAHGANAAIQNAQRTYVGPDTKIIADALTSGDGGKVVVWADGDTHFYGNISARGGELGGNGGWVETSGHESLNAAGFVDASAPNGQLGTWLLDPKNIVVATGGPATLTQVATFGSDATLTDTIATATINAASANVVLQASNDITFTNAVSIATAGVGLTAQAGRSILINANITTNNAPITLIANETVANGVVNANRDPGAAVITMASGTTLASGGADIKLTLSTGDGLTNNTSGNITLAGVNAGAGNVLVVNNGPTAGSGIVRASTTQLITAASAALDVNGAGLGGGIGTLAAQIRTTVTNLAARSQSGGAFFSTIGGVNVGSASLGGLTGITTTGGGNLNIATTGALNQTEAMAIAGTSTFSVGGNAITLMNASNNFTGAVSLTNTGVNNIQLNNNAALSLGAISMGNAAGTLAITANGAITQNGATTITSGTGLASFSTGVSGGDIKLTNANPFRGAVGVTTTGNASIRDTSALNVGASTVGGTLNLVSSASTLTQSGAITANTLNVTATAGNTTLMDLGNVINQLGTINAASRTFAFTNSIGGLTLTNSITATILTLSNTGGDIAGSGSTLAVTGTSTFDAGTHNITLDNAANNFGTVAITSGNNVTLNDTNALILGTSTISGDLAVTTGGAITDSGNLAITGTTSLAAGAANNITLNNSNNFVGAVSIVSGNNVVLNDTGAIDLGASTVSGTLGVTAAGAISQSGLLDVTGAATFAAGATNDITLNSFNNQFSSVGITTGRNVLLKEADALALNASTVSGTLGVTSNGAITDNGNLTVTGVATFDAGTGNDITLNNSNNFGTVSIISGNNVTLNDTGALILGASTVSGTLNVTTAGAITDSGDLNVTGAATFAAGVANDITLNNSNDFSTLNITSADDVTISDINGINLGNVTSDTFNLTTGGAITNSGALAITTTATFNAGSGNDITLNNPANNFGTVVITSGKDVAINDTNALILGTSTISGNLAVTTGGAITDSGNLNITGTTSLAAGTANNITLNNSNNFVGAVSIVSGNNVVLNDAGAIDLGASTVSGTLGVTAVGAITQSGLLNVSGAATFAAGATNDITLNSFNNQFSSVGITTGRNVLLKDANAINLTASTVSGTLGVSSNGNITDSGNLVVTGVATFDPGVGNDVVLDQAGNNFSTVIVNNASNVTLRDTNAITLGGFAVGDTLTVTAGGAITQSGVLTGVTLHAKTLNNVGAAITLNNSANDFTNVSLQARNTADTAYDTGAINYTDASGVMLTSDAGNGAGSGTASTFNLTTVGDIQQDAALTITGTSTFNAGTHDITLDNASNNFSTVSITGGNNVTLKDSNALVLGATTISGNLAVTTAGAITNSGSLNIAGTTSLTAGSANNITLNSGGNNFGGAVSVVNGNNVTLVNAGSLSLNTMNISGDLTLNTGATGDITFNSNINTTGSLNILNANNVTNNAQISAGSFLQNAGSGITNFGSGGFTTTGGASVTTNQALGSVDVGSLSVGLASGSLTGTVAGFGGLAAAQQVTLLTTPTGTLTFNGFALPYSPPPPVPTPTPTPTPPIITPIAPAPATTVVSLNTSVLSQSFINSLLSNAFIIFPAFIFNDNFNSANAYFSNDNSDCGCAMSGVYSAGNIINITEANSSVSNSKQESAGCASRAAGGTCLIQLGVPGNT